MTSYSLETMYEVWDDDDGDHYEIGPDRDGLGLVEVRMRDKDNKILLRMTFPSKQGRLISDAIMRACINADSEKAAEVK